MKKSQLRKIIKEEIQNLQEQPISPPNNGHELLSNFYNWNQQNGPQMDWRCRPDMRSWLVSVFNSAPFSSTNPQQPCTFIQNRINNLQNWVNNFSGNPNSVQLAQKQCKLQVFQAILPWAQQLFNCI